MIASSNHPRTHQRGIVLPVTLIMLLVLTIASLVIVGQISSQTRMATNAAVSNVNMQAAESGLDMVISELDSGTISTAQATYLADTGGFYYFQATNYSSTTSLPWENVATWNALTNSPAITCQSPSGSMQVTSCKYMIEMLPNVVPKGSNSSNPSKYFDYVFRITVRVVGASNQGTVMLQTLYLLPNS
jgi:type IV pilus assembly protein PilX